MTRTCTRCNKTYPATPEYFVIQSRGLHGLTATCKECRREQSKRYHHANPRTRIANQLRYKFGITVEQYDELYHAQHGRCWMCNKHQSEMKKRLAVDHCHATGLIRKLLCQNCNQGFGHFKENPEVLRRAAEYAEMFREPNEQSAQLYISRRP